MTDQERLRALKTKWKALGKVVGSEDEPIQTLLDLVREARNALTPFALAADRQELVIADPELGLSPAHWYQADSVHADLDRVVRGLGEYLVWDVAQPDLPVPSVREPAGPATASNRGGDRRSAAARREREQKNFETGAPGKPCNYCKRSSREHRVSRHTLKPVRACVACEKKYRLGPWKKRKR